MTIVQDLRYAIRSLSRSPVYTAVAVLSLALGIAGNATLFTMVNGLLFKPLPVGEPSRVAGVYTSDYSGSRYSASSYPDFLAFREGLPAFDDLVAVSLQPTSLTTGGESSRAFLGTVSANFFSGLGIPLALGRGFSPTEDRMGEAINVVVLSHQLWASRFGADPGVIGRTALFGGQPFTVIGVARPGFSGILRGLGQDGWVPIAATPLLKHDSDLLTAVGNRGLFIYGHLAPGATLAQAEAQASVLAGRRHEALPEQWTTLRGEGRQISVLPESSARIFFPDARLPLFGASGLLFLVVGAVLLIACANVANLSLTRALARRREIAVRLALGASRRRLVAQLLTESFVVAGVGGALGLLAASSAASLLHSVTLPAPVPIALDFTPDARVLGFTLIVSVFAALLLGLAPALQATTPSLVPALKDLGGAGSARSRLRNGFVVAQATLSLALLITAALFLRSLGKAAAIDPGFRTREGLLVTTDLGLNGYDEARGRVFQQQLVERVRALPSVESAALVSILPLSLGGNRTGVRPEGYQVPEGEDMEVGRSNAGDGYFETLGVPLLQGRSFLASDRVDAPGVAIVNESFVRRYWPGQSGIGRRISMSGADGPWLEVVGVAGDGKYFTLGEAARPFFFVPLGQHWEERTTLVVRTAAGDANVGPEVRSIIRQLDPALPIESVTTLGSHLAISLLPARAGGLVLGGFGLLGLVLASLGIYGVVAYGVSQRQREIGIRVALGAQARDVVRLAVGGGMRLVAIGLVVGLALASGAGVLARGLLYGLAPFDPIAFGVAPAVFALVALLAAWLPARRASAVDPLIALRAE